MDFVSKVELKAIEPVTQSSPAQLDWIDVIYPLNKGKVKV